MAVGFYCTVIRANGTPARRVGFLLGPYDDEPTARERIPDARRLAAEIDPFTEFDLFGTARLVRDELPAGTLNARLEN